MLHTYIRQVIEEAEYFEKPNDNNNYGNHVEDGFNLAIHWNVRVDKPEQNANNNQDNENIK
jgi:hypothetical protein